MSATLARIDLGTTRLKVAAFTPEGELLQQVATRHKETPGGPTGRTRRDGGASGISSSITPAEGRAS